jgi:hypothetical protein
MGTSYRRSTPSTPMNGLHGRNRCIFDLSGHPDEGDSRTFKPLTAIETRRPEGAYAAGFPELQLLDAVLVGHSMVGERLATHRRPPDHVRDRSTSHSVSCRRFRRAGDVGCRRVAAVQMKETP